MKVLPLEVSDLKYLSRVNEEETLEFLRNGLPVILQTRNREFFEVTKEEDYHFAKSLYEQGVYDCFNAYIE